MKYTKTPFALKLKMLRLERGKSQESLAKELDISRSCLANYETGKRQPDNDMLVRIADLFHVMTDYLVDRTEYRNLDFTMQEIKDFTNIKQILNNHGPTLDLSVLQAESRLAVIQYFEYIKAMVQQEKNNKS
ncbi:MAG: helix-turn-helix transcriptional regulator [Ruminococcaceae bacterium]|nr:helix-turn-helix transcriptional regulator [Oscillospiraceae bacterium]